MPTKNNPASLLFYIGTYADSQSTSIHLCHLDPERGELKYFDGVKGGANPSFLALHPSGRYLYAVNELTTWQGQPGGALSAFTVDPLTGQLAFLNQQPSLGTDPCHLIVDRLGRYLLAANYSSGTLAMYPIMNNGKLGMASDCVQHQGHSRDPQRQAGPHAHSIDMDPANRFALSCDLGIDQVLIYRPDFKKGKLLPHAAAVMRPGVGPRHLVFHPDGRFVYVINELEPTITVFAYESASGSLREIDTIATLPGDYSGPHAGAEITVHPSGNFVYGSNRGHDSIAMYRVDKTTGKLTLQGHELTQGKTPRHFVIDPTGAFLLAANQDSNSIILFGIDPRTGALQQRHRIEIPKPVCLLFKIASAK
jgi:6-phosphogluconolactonase